MPKKSSRKPLNKNKRKKSKIEHIRVINETTFDQDSEVDIHSSFDSMPARPFVEVFDIIDRDSRLELSLDTYVQMVLGKGIKCRSSKKKIEKKIKEWWDDIEFEEKVEDGLNSYCGGGNLFWEQEPKMKSDVVEIPLDTMVGITRDKRGKVKLYHQYVNNRDKELKPDNIVQFKFSNTRNELWGRGIFHSILNDYEDPNTGVKYQAPIFAMKDVEDGLVKIIQNYAAPIQMFYFKDAGPTFIKNQGDALKKARPGAKILTDKEFDIKSFEVKGESKFDKYIEHLQRDVIEPGTQFPLQFFNAGFTARAASESTDSVLIRKIKRIQKRFAKELKDKVIFPYLEKVMKGIKKGDFEIFFEPTDSANVSIIDLVTLFRDNGIRRSELRKALLERTEIPIDEADMEDELPITSVTPTNKLTDNNPDNNDPKSIPQRDPTDPKNLGKTQKTKVKVEDEGA